MTSNNRESALMAYGKRRWWDEIIHVMNVIENGFDPYYWQGLTALHNGAKISEGHSPEPPPDLDKEMTMTSTEATPQVTEPKPYPDPFKGLPRQQYQELEDYLLDNLLQSGQVITRLELSAAMFMYGQKYSLVAMYNFKKWMEANGANDQLFSTLIHDLNGRNQDPRTFSPRTSSYERMRAELIDFSRNYKKESDE